MAIYHDYITDFTVSVDEDPEIFTTVEIEFYLKLTYAGCPAKLSGPPEDCYPAEGPEWELDDIFLRFGKFHRIKMEEIVFIALFGQKFFDKHYELAEEEANEEQE